MNENSSAGQALNFLLEEYKELNNTLLINEERSEKRLQFFVTLSSFVLGAIGLFVKGFKAYDSSFLTLIYLIIILFLTGLILIGFIIQKRLKKRNEITDGLKIDIKEIRKIFQEIDKSNGILPEDYEACGNRLANGKVKDDKRSFTSLYHIASVINCVIAGTTFAFISFAFRWPPMIAVAGSIVSALIMAALILVNSRTVYRLTHSGGLVYKKEDGKKKYLVITSSKDPSRWVLPKGHIEQDETPQFTAIREVMEETGILALPVKAIGYQRYVRANENVHVKYYLMKYVQTASVSTEQRKMLWLSKKEAIKQISFTETKRMVEQLY